MLLSGLIQKCPVSVMGVIEQIYMTFSVDNNSFFCCCINRLESGAFRYRAVGGEFATMSAYQVLGDDFINLHSYFIIF